MNDEVQNHARNVACTLYSVTLLQAVCKDAIFELPREAFKAVTMATFERSRLGEGAPDMELRRTVGPSYASIVSTRSAITNCLSPQTTNKATLISWLVAQNNRNSR